ncbi:MAG TPA: spermidine synthase, partial [Actinomycetes bacterium]|nr:spermidine synthase [Actinomycetes bacterium]
LPLIFVAVALTMVGPADLVGRCFQQLPPLNAYRLDLIGSLIGISAFTALSFMRAPSVVWALVVCGVWLILSGPKPPIVVAVSAAAVVALLGVESAAAGTTWSPYYKVTTERSGDSLLVSVNGVPHQLLKPAAEKLADEPQYGLPYERVANEPPGSVLIVGAGTGSDVAIALKKGATSVTAVEIDPRLLQIGEQENPDHAFADPRVSTIVDDGRAVLERTDQKFDLILFALPDSLTLVNGGGGVRLESYLFTREAIEAARDHLTPHGAFAMYNYYREPWLVDRLALTVQDAFGHTPCVDQVGGSIGQAVISASAQAGDQRCGPVTFTPANSTPAPATDDKPFVYVRDNGIPAFYLLAIAVILLISIVGVRLFGGGMRPMARYADLFMMGAAFLLLETRSVTTFALLFGTTWVVNAFVFGGILLVVLAAVEVTRRIRTPSLPWLYLALAVTLGVAYTIPNSWLLSLDFALRLPASVALAFAPVFVANLAFAKRFAETVDSTTAFGANILGAMVGGCMEYLALVVGYRNLLVIVGLLYLCAFLLRPKVTVPLPVVAST